MIKTIHQVFVEIPEEVYEHFYHTKEFYLMYHTATANAISSRISSGSIVACYDDIEEAHHWDQFLTDGINHYKDQL